MCLKEHIVTSLRQLCAIGAFHIFHISLIFVYRSIHLLQWIISDEHKDGHVSSGEPFPCQVVPWAFLLSGNILTLTVPTFVKLSLTWCAGMVFFML